MTTEEEKALAKILEDHLDEEELTLIYSSGNETPPPSRSPHHKNRRWRQLNLKIKIFAGILFIGIAAAAGSAYYDLQHQNVEANTTPNTRTANVQKNDSTLPKGTKKAPDTTKVPAVSVTPSPETPTATPRITPTATPAPPVLPKDWNLILVNPWNALPEGFTAELETIENGHSVDVRIANSLERMLADARAQGLSPMICSSYRTMEKQQTLYANKVNEYLSQGYTQENAESEAGKWVAVPGTSEHQTGLAVDLVSSSYQILDQKQEETPEQKWLMENSYKYGFILRYPNDKREITGIYYEPWHYRYVGYRTALEIHEKGLCYEEYLDTLK